MKDLIHFKHENDEVIASLIMATEDNYIIEKARVFKIVPVNPQQAHVALVPWLVGNPDGTIKVRKDSVGVISEKVSEELSKGYVEQTTGLAIASTFG